MTFPPIQAVAEYEGYRPTSKEIQTDRVIGGKIRVLIRQTSKWKYQAYFANGRKRECVRCQNGEPIRGYINVVFAELARRFERIGRAPVWTYKGKLAPYQPVPRPSPR